MNSNRNLSIIFILSIILTISNCFQPGDDIVVYYLEAPLFFSKFGTLLANINAFHSGLGFRSMNSPESYTIDFVGVPGVLESILPNRIENGEIIWNSAGQVNIKDFIEQNYWSSETEIMKIDYEMFDIFTCWAKNYNETYNYYQLFDVQNTVTNQTILDSTVCNDFVWKGIDALYNIGGLYTSSEIIAKRDLVTIYTKDPEMVVVDNGATNAEVIQFYTAMLNVSVTKNQTVSGLINELDQLFKGVFYLYRDGIYFNITLDTPAISFYYSAVPLASGERSVIDITFIDGCIIVDSGEENNDKDDSLGGGWIFIIVLLSASFSYIVGGCLINKFKNNKSGLDIFPNRESWSNLGGLIGDGFNSIKSKITGNKSTDGYSNI